MHVGVALLTFVPGRVGGTETYLRGLLEQYAAGGGPERVTVIADRRGAAECSAYVGDTLTVAQARHYRIGATPAWRLGAIAYAAAASRRLLRGLPESPDLIHYPLTVPVPRTRTMATVVTLQDVQHHERPEFFTRAERTYRHWAYDRAARTADAVVTPTHHARSRVIEHLGIDPDRIHVVYYGVDHRRFQPARDENDTALDALGIPSSFVIYPANLWPHKNHERLLVALQSARTEASLVLTGQMLGRDSWLRERSHQLGIADRVVHVGYVPSALLPALYRRAQAMVFPSLYEGFGWPPLEAMACSCPVAVARGGALEEVCGEGALLFDPLEVDEIRHAIERLTSDGALRERLQAAGVSRSHAFNWAETAHGHLQAYKRAIDNASTRR